MREIFKSGSMRGVAFPPLLYRFFARPTIQGGDFGPRRIVAAGVKVFLTAGFGSKVAFGLRKHSGALRWISGDLPVGFRAGLRVSMRFSLVCFGL